ncbi:hypothetical protein [Caulobacter sp. S45]|uniref:hypothetical protein n=1 Tax=Caulobacter sp. S45 TaxID=1641861 RepID=UPI001575C1EF|nr:hypothetical protein [Caulobacter sp. S45]
MNLLLWALAGVAGLLCAGAASAQTPQPLGAASTHVPAQPASVVLADGSVVGAANPLPTRDQNGAAVGGFIAIPAPGATVTAGRGIAAVCSAGGQASFVASDGSTLTVPLNVGFNQFGFSVVQVQAGATATCTYTNLK